MSLLVIGSVAFDAIETPFGETGKIVGGAASYISLATSMLHDNVGLVAVVGEDFDMDFVKNLNDRGVDTTGLQIKNGQKSFFWHGKYHMDMNSRDTITTELNVLGDFDPIVPTNWKNPDFVMLGNLSPDVQLKTLERIETRPKMVVLDTMNFWMDIALDTLKEVLKKIDVLTINDEEARQLSGEYSLVKAARVIREMGPRYLIIKKGEHGALLFGEDEDVFFCPALPLEEVFDPTGAGDTFAGGFIGYLAKVGKTDFESMKQAVIYGSAMASFCVEKFGTQKIAEISENDLNNRLQKFSKMMKVQS